MAKIYLDKDADTSVLNGKTISVIGFGSQGKAQAECLRDSGFNVLVGAREGGKSWNAAKAEGFNVTSISDAVKKGDVILFLIPDMEQPKVYEEQVAPNLSPGKALGFAHGFNIHFNVIKPPNYVDVFMVAPKAPGPKLRENFLKGFGVPALLAIHQDYT
ncbi:MAG: ketol-acid reductoisomerase, partial [Candidatus Methanomethylicota archaeon]